MSQLRFARIIGLVLLLVVPAFFLTATSAKAQTPQPKTFTFLTGNTRVDLSPVFVGALTSLNVTPRALGRSELFNGTAFFPIIEGTIDALNAKGEIAHSGGLSLTAGGTRVELRNFVIDTTGGTPVLTGLVVANRSVVGRIPLFDLQLPTSFQLPLRAIGGRIVLIPNVGVTLTQTAATALNGAFGVTAFTAGFNIGTATVIGITDGSKIGTPLSLGEKGSQGAFRHFTKATGRFRSPVAA